MRNNAITMTVVEDIDTVVAAAVEAGAEEITGPVTDDHKIVAAASDPEERCGRTNPVPDRWSHGKTNLD